MKNQQTGHTDPAITTLIADASKASLDMADAMQELRQSARSLVRSERDHTESIAERTAKLEEKTHSFLQRAEILEELVQRATAALEESEAGDREDQQKTHHRLALQLGRVEEYARQIQSDLYYMVGFLSNLSKRDNLQSAGNSAREIKSAAVGFEESISRFQRTRNRYIHGTSPRQ